MNRENKELKDKELNTVAGGVMPIIYEAESKVPGIDSAIIKTEYEKNSFIPLPY